MSDQRDQSDAKDKADKAYREAFIKMNEAHMRGVGVYAAIEEWKRTKEEFKKFF